MADPGLAATAGRGLRAASSGQPSEAPATPLERRGLNERIERSPYTSETAEALAELVHGQGILDRLTAEHADNLGLLIEVAERAAITEPAMKGQLTKFAKRDDRRAAAAWLRQRLRPRRVKRAAPRRPQEGASIQDPRTRSKQPGGLR